MMSRTHGAPVHSTPTFAVAIVAAGFWMGWSHAWLADGTSWLGRHCSRQNVSRYKEPPPTGPGGPAISRPWPPWPRVVAATTVEPGNRLACKMWKQINVGLSINGVPFQLTAFSQQIIILRDEVCTVYGDPLVRKCSSDRGILQHCSKSNSIVTP